MAVADNMPNDTPADLARRIKDLERAVRELSSARTLDRATITAAAGLGVRTADFDGTDFAHPGTAGNYFGGDGAVLNSLYLRPGSVSNDMLTSPVVPGSVWQESTGFTVSPPWATVISVSVTVPAGCTSASIGAKGRVTAYYNNAGTGSGIDYLYANLFIGSLSSDYYPVAVSDNGGSGANHVFRDAVLTGLTPGSAIVLSLQASTGYTTWTAPSSPGNKAKLGAAIQWYR